MFTSSHLKSLNWEWFEVFSSRLELLRYGLKVTNPITDQTAFRLWPGEVGPAGEAEQSPAGGCDQARPGGQPLHQTIQPREAAQDSCWELLPHCQLSGHSQKSTGGNIQTCLGQQMTKFPAVVPQLLSPQPSRLSVLVCSLSLLSERCERLFVSQNFTSSPPWREESAVLTQPASKASIVLVMI